MSLGPVEYVILGFPGNQFTGQIVPELAKLIDGGLVRIIDLTFIMKDAVGGVEVVEYDAVEELAAFAGLDAEVGGILTSEDVAHADHLGGHLGGPVRRSSAQCERSNPRGRTNPTRDHRTGHGRLGRHPRLRSTNPHHSRRMAPPAAPTQQEAIDMPLRRRRPIARMATTAVVAGTAAHMGARSAQRSAAADQDQAPPAPAPADEPAAPEAAESPEIEQLRQFAALRDQGILTEEEFAAQKAKLLNA
jgi:hypothetical protein